MKKLLLLSLALVGLMSLASCKKVLAPSAITVDNTVANVGVQGTVKFKLTSDQILPAPSAYTTVTATATIDGTPYTFSASTNDDGQYAIAIPIKYNTDKVNVTAIKAVVIIPDRGEFKGTFPGAAFNVNKNQVATGKDITCDKVE